MMTLVEKHQELSWSLAQDIAEDQDYWRLHFNAARNYRSRIDDAIERYQETCIRYDITPDSTALMVVDHTLGLYDRLLETFEQKLDPEAGHTAKTHIENTARQLSLLRSSIARSPAWVCGAYDQSTLAQHFTASNYDCEIKYDRYESGRAKELETQIGNLMNFGDHTDVLMTSSGMAAYHVIDAYLRKDVLKANDAVLIVGDLYSEVTESALKGFQGNTNRSKSTDIDAIVKEIEDQNARVVYLDYMENRVGMRFCDVEKVIEKFSEKHPDREITFVIDGTMTSGGDQPFKAARSDNVEVLYHSSCCKYLQFGQDVTSAGFLAFSQNMRSTFDDIRRAQGAILYDQNAWAFPDVSAPAYHMRMKRMTRNALVTAEVISGYHELKGFVEPVFPGLLSHPNHDSAQHHTCLGNLMTFKFNTDYDPDKDALNRFITDYLKQAKRDKIDIVNGESFGFGIPRIYVGWTPSNNFKPFLRLSAGDRDIETVQKTAHSLAKQLIGFRAALDLKNVPAITKKRIVAMLMHSKPDF